MDAKRLTQLVNSLRAMSDETEWCEFKVNNAAPDSIGAYISALSNAAALVQQSTAYLVWGVEDKTHNIIGTNFNHRAEKVGNEDLELWLNKTLSPSVDFRFHTVEINALPVVVLEIPAARHTPIRFKGVEYIRVGSNTRNLRDFPEKERTLWQLFGEYRFERDVALADVSAAEVLRLLDYPAYFDSTGQQLPPNQETIINRFVDERIILRNADGNFNITNFGAILFAKDLQKFDRLGRKALRIIFYRGNNKVNTIREYVEAKGYAIGYESAISFINNLLPMNEQIGQALRENVRMYPEIAIRELVANALIHQDFSVTGASPTVEVFSDCIEITNPGEPLIEPLRFIDKPPRSRNEDIAAFLRRINICEERGSGIDKVIFAVELYQLPPPDFKVNGDNTIAVLYADKPLSEMTKQEKVRACYQHTVLRYVSNDRMTNTSLRERFNIQDKNAAIASRIIKETIKQRLIKPFDPENKQRKQGSYVPIWVS